MGQVFGHSGGRAQTKGSVVVRDLAGEVIFGPEVLLTGFTVSEFKARLESSGLPRCSSRIALFSNGLELGDQESLVAEDGMEIELTAILLRTRELIANEIVEISDFGDNLENANLLCGFRCRSKDSKVDIGTSCVKFNEQGHCCGFVYFADKEDHENGICHIGGINDTMTDMRDLHDAKKSASPMDDESISFTLSGISSDVHFLFFVATIFLGLSVVRLHSFQDVSSCRIRLVDASSNNELLNFESNRGTGNALVIAMIFRKAGRWHFEAVDEYLEHSNIHDLEVKIQNLCLQKKEQLKRQRLDANDIGLR